VRDSALTYAGLLGFLGLQSNGLKNLRKTNSSQLEKISSVVSPQLKDEMANYFAPQIKTVSNFLGRRLDHWI
jgi:hypothetical protein